MAALNFKRNDFCVTSFARTQIAWMRGVREMGHVGIAAAARRKKNGMVGVTNLTAYMMRRGGGRKPLAVIL